MATNVTLNLKVNDGEIDDLNKELNSLRGNINKVETASSNAGGEIKKIGDNGGAISTLDSFTGGLATRVRDAAEATKVFNFSLKGTRTALIATGIGALVVALGIIVAYWDDILDYIKQVNARLEQQLEYSRRLQENLSFEIELLNIKEEIQKTEGRTTDEIIEKKKKLIELLQAENKAELDLLEKQRTRLINKIQEVTLAEAIYSYATGNKGFVGVSDTENESLTKITEGIKEAQKQALELELQLAKINNPESSGKPKDVELVRGDNQEKATSLPLTGLSGMDDLDNALDAEFNAIALKQTARNNLEQAGSDYRKWLANEEAQAKIESYYLAADAFGAASNLIGESTAAGKAFSVASTLISTYMAAQHAYASQMLIATPDAPFRAASAAAIAVISGLANVKNILSVQVPGQGGGSSVSGGSASTPPAFNVVQSNPQNQLNQALLENNNEPVQAFVVEKDVSTAEELRRNKVSSSSL